MDAPPTCIARQLTSAGSLPETSEPAAGDARPIRPVWALPPLRHGLPAPATRHGGGAPRRERRAAVTDEPRPEPHGSATSSSSTVSRPRRSSPRPSPSRSRRGQPLGQILVQQGAITRLELASALAEQWSDQSVSISLLPVPKPAPKPVAAAHDDDQYAARLQDAVADLARRVHGTQPSDGIDERVTDLAERIEATRGPDAAPRGHAGDARREPRGRHRRGRGGLRRAPGRHGGARPRSRPDRRDRRGAPRSARWSRRPPIPLSRSGSRS